MKTCTTCGQTKALSEFYASKGKVRHRCKECEKAWHREYNQRYKAEHGKYPTHRDYRRTCIECGTEWISHNGTAKYCSNRCQAAHEHGPDRRPKRKPEPRPTRHETARRRLATASTGTRGRHVLVGGWCALCGAAAIEGPGNQLGSVFYCSGVCRRTARGKGLHPKISLALRAYIYRRDRGICHLCRKRVAMTKIAPHPRSPVLDHLVPLSLGGSTTRENLRLAHRPLQ